MDERMKKRRIESVMNESIVRVEKVQEGMFRVKSFREIDTTYDVDMLKQTCNCVAWSMGRTRPCKHISLVQKHLEYAKGSK
jgi:hypothetical protein